ADDGICAVVEANPRLALAVVVGQPHDEGGVAARRHGRVPCLRLDAAPQVPGRHESRGGNAVCEVAGLDPERHPSSSDPALEGIGSPAMATLTGRESGQVDAANSAGRTPVVFIHGLWLLASSWDRWATLFEHAGFAPVAPGWPDDPETVEEARAHPEVFAGKKIGQVADHV